MAAKERFSKLVEALYDDNDAPAPTEEGGLLVRHLGRVFHLGLNDAREELAISTAVYFSFMDGADLHPDMVADFNAYHLYHGGYRMGINAEEHALYVSQTKSLGTLEASGLGSYLEDFVARCSHCTKWCMDEIAKRPAPDLFFSGAHFPDIESTPVRG